jgi:TadE-like protein
MRLCREIPSSRLRTAQRTRTAGRSSLPARRGQAVLEFALIFLVIYLLIVAIFEFGRLFTGAQTLQTAVDQAARELSRVPLPSTATFADALASQQVIDGVFDPNYLAISLSGMQPGQSIFDFFAAERITLPSVNQALLPMMISDSVNGAPLLRYPGALVTSTPTTTKPGYSGFTVAVPLVVSPAGIGPETIEWHAVLEEITDATGAGAFSVASTPPSGLPGGVVAVRLNYPFQAATMAGYQPPPLNANGETLPNAFDPMLADDGGVTATNAIPGGGSAIAPDPPPADAQSGAAYAGPYGGTYGLGEMGLYRQTVRPFRRVLSAQAVVRREVFGP